jgi:uncharacterized protein
MPDAASAAASTSLDWGGQRLVLLPGKAVWLPERRCLLVADVHLGKAASFRRLGVPVPSGTTADTLARLGALLQALGARQLVFLGDLFHAAAAQSPAVQAPLAAWRVQHAGVTMSLVRGNHDAHAGDPPSGLDISVVDEPWVLAPMASAGPVAPSSVSQVPPPGLALCHHPQSVPGYQVLAGHDHPCVHIGGRGRDHVRLPCFHFADDVGVLPAFGSFTGMHPVRRVAGDRVYALTGEAVVALGPPPSEPLNCPPCLPSNT